MLLIASIVRSGKLEHVGLAVSRMLHLQRDHARNRWRIFRSPALHQQRHSLLEYPTPGQVRNVLAASCLFPGAPRSYPATNNTSLHVVLLYVCAFYTKADRGLPCRPLYHRKGSKRKRGICTGTAQLLQEQCCQKRILVRRLTLICMKPMRRRKGQPRVWKCLTWASGVTYFSAILSAAPA